MYEICLITYILVGCATRIKNISLKLRPTTKSNSYKSKAHKKMSQSLCLAPSLECRLQFKMFLLVVAAAETTYLIFRFETSGSDKCFLLCPQQRLFFLAVGRREVELIKPVIGTARRSELVAQRVTGS